MKKSSIEIRKLVVDLIIEMIPGTGNSIEGDQSLQSLGFDSLRLMSLVVAAEDRLGIYLKDIYLTGPNLKTIDSLVGAFTQSQDM